MIPIDTVNNLVFVSAATTTLVFMYHFVPLCPLFSSVKKGFIDLLCALFDSKPSVKQIDCDTINIKTIPTPIIKYEEAYLDKYLTRVVVEQDEEKEAIHADTTYSNKILMEMTPNGNVVMFYSTDRESFQYYSDNSIPYRYLESVARKYVLTFNCLHLYIDMQTELKKMEQEAAAAAAAAAAEATLKTGETTEVDSKEKQNLGMKKPVFAKFKNYNKATSLDSVMPQQHHQQQHQQQQQHVKKKEEKNTKADLKAKANRFSYEGKILNFMFLKKPTIPITSQQKTSYADFKASCWVRIEPSLFSE